MGDNVNLNVILVFSALLTKLEEAVLKKLYFWHAMQVVER